MNLPFPEWSSDSEWPPKRTGHVMRSIREWSAWYEGNPEDLAAVYRDPSAQRFLAARPTQYAGGVVGRVARWFWGQPIPPGQSRPKLHMPVPSDIATASADMLFGEELEIRPSDGQDMTRLDEILDGNRWQSLLPEAGEAAAALSGVYLRLAWDKSIADYPLISVVHADGAIPEFRWGRLVQVTFWQRVREDGNVVLRWLETHQPGRVVHQLFQGGPATLGSPVPLSESEQTAGIPVDDQSSIQTGITQLTAAYIPNIKPTRKWRTDPHGCNLGRSDFEGIEPLFDAIDETWSSWMRDLRLGKGRVMIARNLLQSAGPGAGAGFDMDQEIFLPIGDIPLDGATALMTPQQFDIRVTEHRDTLHELLASAYQSAGYSPATFGLQDQVATTATEVAARERRTMTTREKKTRYWTPALEDFLQAVTALDQAQFGKGQGMRPKVSFPASVSPSIGEVAQSVQALNAAQAASIDTRVRMVHPDWDDLKVSEEVARIMAENAMTTPTITVDPQIDPNAASSDTASIGGADEIKAKADAMGVLIRAGVENDSAAAQVGLPGLDFRPGAIPITIKLPGSDGTPA